nr:GT-D fold domain-containing protein [Bacteroidales bacterium]
MLEVRKKLRQLYYAYIKAHFIYKETSQWHILNNWETLDYLHQHHCSISRFGDGEFGIIWGWGNGFQQYDEKLASRLQEVLSATDAPNHMNAIPYPLKNWKG